LADLTTKRVPIGLGGINKKLDPASLNSQFTPYMNNMLIADGKLRKFGGYSRFTSGTEIPSLTLAGVGNALYNYCDARGNAKLIAVAGGYIFAYDLSNGWYQMTPGKLIPEDAYIDTHASFTVDIGAAIDWEIGIDITCVTAVSDATKIAYDNFAAVDCSAQTKVTGWIKVSDGVIPEAPIILVLSESADGAKVGSYVEVSVPMPTALDTWTFFSVSATLTTLNAVISVGIWNNVSISWAIGDRIQISGIRCVKPLSAVGDFHFVNAIDTSMFTNNGGAAAILTNNVNDLQYWEGLINTPFQTLVHTFPSFAHCRDIVEFYNYFMMLNYKDTTDHAQTIIHSGAGDLNDQTSASSGSYTLFDSVGQILRVIKLGYNLIIFSERSIIIGVFLGSVTKFAFYTITTNLGIFSTKAAVSIGDRVYFIGSDQRFYYLEVSGLPVEIGRAVSEDFFSNFPTVFTDPTKLVAVYNDERLKRVIFQRYISPDTTAYAFNYNEPNNPWEYLSLSHRMKDLIFIEYRKIEYSDYEKWYLALSTSGELYKFDESGSFKMDTTDIACEYQTEDISINEEFEYARWQEFLFTAKSSVAAASVTVQYSTDNGSTWKDVDESPITLENNKWKSYLVHFDVVSRVVRVRFTQTAKDLQIKDNMFISFIPENEKEIEVE
jgi:hypothetical protein